MSARSLHISEYLQLPEALCCLAIARCQVLWRPARSWMPKGPVQGAAVVEADADRAEGKAPDVRGGSKVDKDAGSAFLGGHKEGHTDPEFSTQQLTRARAVASLVRGMAVRVPWKTHCLDEALALHYMLRRRAVRHRFHLGVHKSGNTELKAHAWVSVGPSVVIGSAGRQAYKEVAVIEL